MCFALGRKYGKIRDLIIATHMQTRQTNAYKKYKFYLAITVLWAGKMQCFSYLTILVLCFCKWKVNIKIKKKFEVVYSYFLINWFKVQYNLSKDLQIALRWCYYLKLLLIQFVNVNFFRKLQLDHWSNLRTLDKDLVA